MKCALTFFLLGICCNLYAQYRVMAPQPPRYSIVSQPGATLAQVLDTMYAHANTANTVRAVKWNK